MKSEIKFIWQLYVYIHPHSESRALKTWFEFSDSINFTSEGEIDSKEERGESDPLHHISQKKSSFQFYFCFFLEYFQKWPSALIRTIKTQGRQVRMVFVTLKKQQKLFCYGNLWPGYHRLQPAISTDIRPPEHPWVKQIKGIVWQTFHKYETFPEETLEWNLPRSMQTGSLPN